MSYKGRRNRRGDGSREERSEDFGRWKSITCLVPASRAPQSVYKRESQPLTSPFTLQNPPNAQNVERPGYA